MSAMPLPNLLDRLRTAFEWIEKMDLRVGDVWLNQVHVEELFVRYPESCDRVVREETLRISVIEMGAPLMGYLWGARVFQSDIAPVNHVALVPADLHAKLVGPAACMPF